MLQGHPRYKNINFHLLWLPFSTPSSSLILLSKFWNNCCQTWYLGPGKVFFIKEPFGICIAALLKHREAAPKEITTQFIQADSRLQVLYLCFVFKIHLWNYFFQILCSYFQPPKCKLWCPPVSKCWNLESAFSEDLLEHISALTLTGPFFFSPYWHQYDPGNSGSLHLLSPRLVVLQISFFPDKIQILIKTFNRFGSCI